MNQKTRVITKKSVTQSTDFRGDHRRIVAETTLVFRQMQCRPLNEDNIRGIRTDAEIRGSGEWVIAS